MTGVAIGGEMLTGPAHHAIYTVSPPRWLDDPERARHRRDEIVGHVKSELRPPDYEYDDDASAAAPAAPCLAPAP